MKQRLMLFILWYLLFCKDNPVKGQNLYDSFGDGDFHTAPVWLGDTASWAIVTDSDVAAGAVFSHTLRLQAPMGSPGNAYLATEPALWGTAQEWGFFVGRRAQTYTATNRLYIWLYATESNLLSSTISGYRILIGDNASAGDKIQLQYVLNGSVQSTVFASAGALPNGITDAGFLLRVTRDINGVWSCYTSVLPAGSGEGAIATDLPDAVNTSVLQATGSHAALPPGVPGFMGIAGEFTASQQARTAIEIDQVYFTPLWNTPPAVAVKTLSVPADTANAGNTVVLQKISLAVSGGNVSLNGITMTTAGTYQVSDIDSLAVYYSADSLLDLSDILFSSQTSGLAAGSHPFAAIHPLTILDGDTGYLIITAAISLHAMNGNNIYISAASLTDIHFNGNVSLNGTDPLPAGGIKTIRSRRAEPGDILINQFHTGYSGASNEYIELVNLTNKTLDLSLLRITYQSSAGSNSSAGGILSGMLPPHAFWLLATGNNLKIAIGLTDSIAIDGNINSGLASSNGQIALIRTIDNTIIDGIAYGSVTVNNLGTGNSVISPGTTGQSGVYRTIDGQTSGDNAADFQLINNSDILLRNRHSILGAGGGTITGGNYDALYITGNTVISGPLSLKKLLSVTNHATLLTGDHLTLLAENETCRALIAPVTGNIQGYLTTEQYIAQGKQAYRHLATGVNTATNIFSNWQENGSIQPKYGTHITGSIGAPGQIDHSTGFDYTANGIKSMQVYMDTSWADIPSTNQAGDTLSAYKGYKIRIRGDRTTDLAISTEVPMPGETILRATGNAITGTVTIQTTGTNAMNTWIPDIKLNPYPGSFSMIANPYLAPVDFNSIISTATGLAPMYWYFDPTIGAHGAYITWDGTINSGASIGSIAGPGIQPGQAFFVRNATSQTSTPSLTFHETDKKIHQPLTPVFKTTATGLLSVSLWKEINHLATGLDAAVIAWGSQYDQNVTDEDGIKMQHAAENVFIAINNQRLSICKHPDLQPGDSLHISLEGLEAQTTYTIQLQRSTTGNGNILYLYDAYTQQFTPIQNNDTISIAFSVTQDTATFYRRFYLVTGSSSPLSISSLSLQAINHNDKITLEWLASDPVKDQSYTVERSEDGSYFYDIHTLPASHQQKHAYTDSAHLIHSTYYYRVRRKKQNNTTEYSNTVVVNRPVSARYQDITVYPNPSRNGIFYLNFPEMINEAHTIELSNLSGQVLYRTSARKAGGRNSLRIATEITSPGIYYLNIHGRDWSTCKTVMIIP